MTNAQLRQIALGLALNERDKVDAWNLLVARVAAICFVLAWVCL